MKDAGDKRYLDAAAEGLHRIQTRPSASSSVASSVDAGGPSAPRLDLSHPEPPKGLEAGDWTEILQNADNVMQTVQLSEEYLSSLENKEAAEHEMTVPMNCLQTLGAEPEYACPFAYAVTEIVPSTPSFIEAYGKGGWLRSHTLQRNLNVNGLDAFDTRTTRPDGKQWDFTKKKR